MRLEAVIEIKAMAVRCKYCGSSYLIKNGLIQNNLQRYLCKYCGRVQRNGDKRLRYSDKERKTALLLHLDGFSFRKIGKILHKWYDKKIPNQTICKWVKKYDRSFWEILKNSSDLTEIIDILEMAELFTHRKNEKKFSHYC